MEYYLVSSAPHHPPADPGVHLVPVLEQADGDGERGAAGARAEGGGEGRGHVRQELEGEAAGGEREQRRQHEEAVDTKSDDHRTVICFL